MVWTKEKITFCKHCPVLQKSIILSEDLKLSMAKNAQKVHRFVWWDALQGGLRSPPNIGTSYFSNWNIVFSCWREGCIWSEAFPMKLIAKLALFCPSESLLPGRVLEVRYPCDKPWASNTMPPFAFPDSTRANPFQRQHKSEYCGPICVLNYQDKRKFWRDTSSVFFLGWDQNWLVAC